MWGPSCTSCVGSELLPQDSLLPFAQPSRVARPLQDWEPPAVITEAVDAMPTGQTMATSCWTHATDYNC